MTSPRNDLSEEVYGQVTQKLLDENSMLEGFVGFYNYMNADGVRCWDIIEPQHQHNDVSLSMSEHLAAFFRERRDLSIRQVLVTVFHQEDE